MTINHLSRSCPPAPRPHDPIAADGVVPSEFCNEVRHELSFSSAGPTPYLHITPRDKLFDLSVQLEGMPVLAISHAKLVSHAIEEVASEIVMLLHHCTYPWSIQEIIPVHDDPVDERVPQTSHGPRTFGWTLGINQVEKLRDIFVRHRRCDSVEIARELSDDAVHHLRQEILVRGDEKPDQVL